uniref:SRCR domain-containing protein n=1 Tax=Neolamprologus brichardi TaxID=32507 RepID=A0A3Q4GE69_NEOBR
MSHRTQGRQSLFTHRFTAENSVTGKSSSTALNGKWTDSYTALSTQSAVYNMPHSPTHTSISKHKCKLNYFHTHSHSDERIGGCSFDLALIFFFKLTLFFADDSLLLLEPVRLVGGAHRCAGTLKVKHLGEWRPVDVSDWTLEEAAVVCEQLDCGLAVSVGQRVESSDLFKELLEQNLLSLILIFSDINSFSVQSLIMSGLGRASCCAGILEPKHLGKWRPVKGDSWTQNEAAIICEHDALRRSMWLISRDCLLSRSLLGQCAASCELSLTSIFDITCSAPYSTPCTLMTLHQPTQATSSSSMPTADGCPSLSLFLLDLSSC